MPILTEETLVDSIEITETNHVQVRRATVIKRDGVEVSRGFHRHVLYPGQDLTGEDPKVTAVATVLWTPEVIAAYQASLPQPPAPPEPPPEPAPAP